MMSPAIGGSYGRCTSRTYALELLAGLALPLCFSLSGCGRGAASLQGARSRTYWENRIAAVREAPPSEQETSIAPAIAPRGRMLFYTIGDYSGHGKSDELLAIGEDGGMIAYADPDGDGVANWMTDMKVDLIWPQLFSVGEKGEIVKEKASPMDQECLDYFSGRHPSNMDSGIIQPPARTLQIAARTTGHGRVYNFVFENPRNPTELLAGNFNRHSEDKGPNKEKRAPNFLLRVRRSILRIDTEGPLNYLSWRDNEGATDPNAPPIRVFAPDGTEVPPLDTIPPK